MLGLDFGGFASLFHAGFWIVILSSVLDAKNLRVLQLGKKFVSILENVNVTQDPIYFVYVIIQIMYI